ncbi:hypothetical protein EFS38_04880 [Dickeya undicola]|uniref:Uncharacterized protein n=1 Tax=Dickeya undicola TaxID=1577887 RepID=A0A3N0GAR9_9GAMM|nr:hypothetical protein EF878_01815 [Dickeya undicola]RNM27065.1 hypothetical protein EFS38_04880 [Dickeya undicola]
MCFLFLIGEGCLNYFLFGNKKRTAVQKRCFYWLVFYLSAWAMVNETITKQQRLTRQVIFSTAFIFGK